MKDDTNIRLEYLEGTDYTYVSETIELEWTQVFCDGPVMVVAKETYYNAVGGVAYCHECEYDNDGNRTKELKYSISRGIYVWNEYEYTTITPSSEVAESKPE